jgi:hypothetical protein
MFNLSELLAPLVPHIESARDACEQWGQVIVARLDAIHHAVLAEDFDEMRQRLPVTIGPTTGRMVVAEIPVGHEWMLENWAANLTTAGAFIVRAGDQFVFGKTPVAVDSGGGNDLIVSGRATITIESVGATAGTVYLQFSRRLPGAKPRRFGGGMTDVTPRSPRVLAPPNEHMPAYPVGKILTRG